MSDGSIWSMFFRNKDGQFVAVGMSRAAFRGQGRWISTQEVMDNVDVGATSIPVPKHVRTWMNAEELLGAYADAPHESRRSGGPAIATLGRCGTAPGRSNGRPEESAREFQR